MNEKNDWHIVSDVFVSFYLHTIRLTNTNKEHSIFRITRLVKHAPMVLKQVTVEIG